jgi:RimJ/RimL family protein N-acetyltransferase
MKCLVSESATMLEAATYSATERLRDGRSVEIRALRPEDKHGLIAAVERTSPQSLYRRFFGVKSKFSEAEVSFFLDIDFVNHVALVAVVEEGGRAVIVGGGRFVVERPGRAEIAFAVIDQYQGRGLGAALLRHLVVLARNAGIKEFVAEVLADNTPMLKVFEKSGLAVASTREGGVMCIVLELYRVGYDL